MAPFEVVGGSHPADLRSGQRRFFQYQYTLRIINPDAIGQDVPLPTVVIHYRVNSRSPGNAALQGRDLTYVLPPADDARPVAGARRCAPTSATRRARASRASRRSTFRAGVLEIAAVTLVALGVADGHRRRSFALARGVRTRQGRR